MDHDEVARRASGEETANTGMDEDNSTDQLIDGLDHQLELDMDKSFDSDTFQYDSTDEFIAEMEDLDHQIDNQIDSIDQYFDETARLDQEIDELITWHRIEDTIEDLNHLFDDGTDHSLELDTEEFLCTDTDKDDLTGELDDDISHAQDKQRKIGNKLRRSSILSSDLGAKVRHTKSLPTSTKYATLSHCWGKGVVFKLLQNNLEELSQEIPIGQLPKVFQDAIHVSHELGINYIWIDSLCIIQDSKEDWTNESKKMGNVYSNGEFNVAATGYEDGLSGLFGERKAFSHMHIPLRMKFELVGEYGDTEAAFNDIYITADTNEFRTNVMYGPLNDRAWVAQERTLAPAVIHYTPEKIYWQCNESIASEDFLNGSCVWEKAEGFWKGGIRSLSAQSEREEIYSFWRAFLQHYAVMAMTFHRDRFPAVAGIARILSEFIDDNLVAGFWEGDLLRSLLMERTVLTRRNILPEQLAPSWSWISFYATLSPSYLETALGEYKSQLEPLNGVGFKVLSDIRGFKSDLDLPSLEKSGVRGLAIKGALRQLPDDFKKHSEWLNNVQMNYDNERPVKFLADSIPQEQAWRFNDPTHMLLLAREWLLDEEWNSVHGLLVQSVEDSEANSFRRSGSIELVLRSGKKGDEYLGLREKDGEYEPTLFFEERGLQDVILL